MSTADQSLSIGAVSRLTGVPTDTIRTWERRHAVVEPQRSPTGRRVYSAADAERLRIVAQLVAKGDRVADLASLDSDALIARLHLHEPVPQGMPSVVRVVTAHPTAARALDGALDPSGVQIEVVGQVLSIGDLADVEADVLVIELEAAESNIDTLSEWIEASGARATVVTAGFVNRPLRKQLEALSVRVLTRPVPAIQLRQAVLDALRWQRNGDVVSSDETVSAPLFSQPQLNALMNLRPELVCECPNHLAKLVIAVREFESYSLQCESLTPEDAALHGDMARDAGAIRSALERLLVRVCEHDGIDWAQMDSE